MAVLTQLGIGLLLILVAFVVAISPELLAGDMEYRLTACDALRGEPANDSIELVALSDSLTFSQVLNTYCNSNSTNMQVSYSKKGYLLEVLEVFDGETAARCICPLKIQGRISNLEKGEYYLRFVFDNRYTGETGVVGEFNVSVV
jgi:hypothetical protein